ncbi:unnamed protein product [Mycena citricolor]|uniref:Reverse transcriptase domain-containing protein n=1 Tax=Mycena citricolor TaxID=2018698 RepID=A0AAD2H4V9_9AGAR|nr:unnamed protein product [Mycena citricolor]
MDVYVQITGLDSGKTRGVKALLDSGCSTCCIDTDYARAEKLDIQELPQPIVARNADNTENISGRITHYVDLRMRIGPHVETRTFLLTCLGKARIFIGLDWLTEHNPEVDWQEQTMRFSRCPERCHMRGHEEHQAMIDMDAIDLDTGTPDLEEGESILLVDFGKEVDLRLKETPAQKFAEEAEKEKERMTKGKIPDQYREFVKVFAKESFNSLQPFKVTQGVRQGNPLSCLLFNLAIEPLAESLRQSNLKGIKIKSKVERLIATLFADDTIVYLDAVKC